MLISVVVPAFNSGKFIFGCLESISKIDYPKLEVIVVNDGSTDNTKEEIVRFSKEYHKSIYKFLVLHNDKNEGISYSKNLGLSKITGQYYFIAGSDDIQLTDRISVPLRYMISNPSVDIVYFDCQIIAENDSVISEKRGFPKGMDNKNSILHQMMRNHFWSGMFLAKSTVNVLFDINLSSAVDYDWYFKLYFTNHIIHFIDDRLIKYRTHRTNISNNYIISSSNVRVLLEKYDFNKLLKTFEAENNDLLLITAFAWYKITVEDYSGVIEIALEVDSNSRNYELNFVLAVSYFKIGDFKKSLKIFEELYTKHPNDCCVINNLAVCLFTLNKNSLMTSQLFATALKLNPRYSDARFNLNKPSSNPEVSYKVTVKPLRTSLIHSEHYKL
jgi:glycosyltransferase involved in cell wall biosynthesis